MFEAVILVLVSFSIKQKITVLVHKTVWRVAHY